MLQIQFVISKVTKETTNARSNETKSTSISIMHLQNFMLPQHKLDNLNKSIIHKKNMQV